MNVLDMSHRTFSGNYSPFDPINAKLSSEFLD